MPTGFKDMVAAARAKVGVVTPADAAAMAAGMEAAILDVREPAELAAGRLEGPFIAIPRGLLEPKADGESGMGEPALLEAKGEPVLVLCAVGGRAALAAATLADMGYDARVIEGGFAAWKAAGLPSTSG